MLKKFGLGMASIAAITLAGIAGSASARPGGDDIRLTARMEGKGTLASGKSVYRERMRGTNLEQRWKVEVEDAAPNATLEIFVNGQMFGTITANDLGFAEIEFTDSTPDDNPQDEEPPVPENFPRLQAGDTITVGVIGGTYR